MSRELVVSSNRHETKVAVLEDDQVVEVYFQRANEYSLAGSIHKGRVTRVLPGMQSAFVDLGLERDTFLYVSDFFEDIEEEYDRIPAGDRPPREERGARAEDRPARGDRPERPARAEPPTPLQAAAPGTLPELEAPPQAERSEDDRRGRRSRRRRSRGRGFPESKYVSEVPSRDAEPVEAPAAEDDEFAVLPGESLAKYRRPSSPAAGPGEAEAEPGPEEELGGLPESGSAEGSEDEWEFDAPCSAAESPAPAGLSSEDAEALAEDLAEAVEQRLSGAGSPAPEEDVDAAEAEPAGGEAEEGDEPLTVSEPGPPQPDAELAFEEAGEPAGDAEAAEISEPETEAAEAAEPEAETVEPMRQPQSLTAALREQGGRFPHRVSRRVRRKMRGGGLPEARSEAPAAGREPRAEVRDSRPEGRDLRERESREVARPERPGTPSITELLKEGQEILVQVAKEPLGQKGARITSHIALPGRYVVYMPTVDHMGVSRKIPSDEERMRLKRILLAHSAGIPGGFIVRTAGEGKSEDEIARDMSYLFNLWLELRQKAEKKRAPALIHHDLEIVQRTLRDQLSESFKAIWVDNEEVYESVLRFVQRFQPALVNRVKMYTRPAPIFDAFGISSELEKALRPKVWLKSGGYIVINQTEALVAIDVNTGKFVGKSNRLEDTIVKTNTEAVKEIVRQVRLRDLGGIIVIDFIDMDERKNRQKVMQALEEAMRADRAPYKILQFNDFGLVAITRKRVKQSLERTLCAPCPYCEGAGYVKSVETVIGDIIQEAGKIAAAVRDSKDVVLRAHPEVAKVLKSHKNQYLEEIESILGRPVLVTGDPLLHQEKFDLS